jgi:RNA polymerase sigma factor (sigma-70 family)
MLADRPAPGDMAADVATRLAVRSVLAALTERQRAVVVLRLFDDLSEAQVAEILGCAVGTVKATMSQAMARLRNDPQLAELMERKAT